MSERLTIHIPYDLARLAVWQRKTVTHYQTNSIIKALDTWLVLKHETRSGWLQNWNQQKDYLLKICKIGESVFRTRLRILQDLQLIKYSRHSIKVCSWDQLGTTLEINPHSKLTVQYDPNDNKRIQDWIIAAEIKDNQSRQSYMIIKKVYENPVHKNAVTRALIRAGADKARIKDPVYVLTMLKAIYLADFVQASEIHSLMIEIRPDTNRGVKGMADAWKFKDPCSVSYWKKVLQRSGIIDIAKLQVQSQERVRNESCHVLWLPKCKPRKGMPPQNQPKQTVLCLCDQITILEPWSLKTICKDYTDNEDRSNSNLSAN